jgi:undecaprenyl-diphosphatase
VFAPAVDDPPGGPDDGVLQAVSAVTSMTALRRALIAFAGLAVAFMVVSAVVAAGDLNATDLQVAITFNGLWRAWLSIPARVFAELGGLELTGLFMAGIGVYLYRLKFRSEAWVVVTYLLENVVELVYKHLVHHPGPGHQFDHGDGPSITDLLGSAVGASSYPSGHMTRTVLVYGLLAFIVHRMAERRWVRLAAVPAAVLICVLMAIDRLYLGVHWESDVLGGALLGAVALAAAVIWLDRPRGIPGE